MRYELEMERGAALLRLNETLRRRAWGVPTAVVLTTTRSQILMRGGAHKGWITAPGPSALERGMAPALILAG